MDLPNTLQLLARNPELCAWRPSLPVIRMNPGLQIYKVFIPKPYKWVPCYADIIATDWMTGTGDQARKFFMQQREQAEAS